ncbi:GntR family transcriptional regulator [Pseudomonas fluorescens]|uniref:GntR family transcriptional regulator n=1 Tax=Pseudomonas fluorescens TaxID=294 RepID=UPI0012426163|nr:GntR family transcriptional regulator [Pseudomonas fluorescens]VVO92228.1 putative D-xylose utilization operon transcriptional repressor [Pseudomonas fluorescens]VVO96105.1 putative D-xylose utilization operon transcriptional repressor [Pseudomonas fluorescens]
MTQKNLLSIAGENIDRRSLDRKAADCIRDAIISGQLALGSRLTEIGLAAQVGLSRSTVRAALQRLSGEGLVVQHAYTGWEVFSLSSDDARELYTLRSCLEGLAARLAAENIDSDGKKALSAALKTLKLATQRNDWRAIAEADLAVHKTIVSIANHRRLLQQYALIIDTVLLYILSTNRMVGSAASIYPEHKALVDAIISGDVALAEQLASEHVTVHGQRLTESLRNSGH